MGTVEQKFAPAFCMMDQTYAQHPNPWGLCTLSAELLLLELAICGSGVAWLVAPSTGGVGHRVDLAQSPNRFLPAVDGALVLEGRTG